LKILYLFLKNRKNDDADEIKTGRIRGRALILLKKLIQDGFAFPCDKYSSETYRRLKKEFPSIQKVYMKGRVIFFIGDKKILQHRLFLNL
jgi:hypothetical protein